MRTWSRTFWILGVAANAVCMAFALFAGEDALRDAFCNPPQTAKPHTWFHMMNGNVSKEGITRDFEEIARAGLGGVQMFDAGCGLPEGPVRFNSPEWFELLRHADKEARRLGLEICLPNCSGWSSSGGPWNPASNAMKRVVFSETRVRAGERIRKADLPHPAADGEFYKDIAVLAFPVPPALDEHIADGHFVVEGAVAKAVLEEAREVSGYSCRFDFPKVWRAFADVTTEISHDGVRFEPYGKHRVTLAMGGVCNRDYQFAAFRSPETVRAIRCSFSFTDIGGKPFPAARVTGLRLEQKLEIPDLPEKTFARRGAFVRLTRAASPRQRVSRAEVVSVGNEWIAPRSSSKWAVLRVGYASIRTMNHPASKCGVGLEVDKLSASAVSYHFNQYVDRVCEQLNPVAESDYGLKGVLVDSYEVGCQNWTQGFEEAFRRCCGYDVTPFLPVFAGYIVGSTDETERFLWDFRRTIADLFADNYAGTLARKCHEYGLSLHLEPYGSKFGEGPFDNLQYGRHADVPMGEFWSLARVAGYPDNCGNAKFASFAAHVWGRKVVAAESFTANPGNSGAWLTTPELIKPMNDAAYAAGVNRIVYHRYVHQPWADDRYVPGLTLGQWGMHFDRHNTWWPYARAFVDYQTRCQALLQCGNSVADVLFWCGEDAPNDGGNMGSGRVSPYSVPYGYDYDVCDTEALLELHVDHGAVVAPGGNRYQLLVLPELPTMSRRVCAKVNELIRAGAKVSCGRLPKAAPGLRDGDFIPSLDGIFVGAPEMALANLGVRPDVAFGGGKRPRWCHRQAGNDDWYFVCRNNKKQERVSLSFRVSGRTAEIWDAATGRMMAPVAVKERKDRTDVDFDLETCGSRFVVFREKPTAGLVPCVRSMTGWGVDVPGPWRVSFETKYPGAPGPRQFDTLVSWTELDDPDVRYLSGSATYRKTVVLGSSKRTVLRLGEVKNFAEVAINGRTYPVLWKPPFEVDISDSAKVGENDLSIKVTNLWPNRLIGDDRLPADVEWGKPEGKFQPILGIPQWVKDGKPSPTGRHTFTTWRFWRSDDKLLPSGLLGPVCVLQE